MRRLLAVLALSTASSVAAQTPATTPVVPSAKSGGSSGFELRVSGFMINGDRSYELSGSPVFNTAGSLKGMDVLLRGKAAGIAFRSMTGTFGDQPHVTSGDVRLLILPPVFSLTVGGGRRALWSDLNVDAPTVFDLGLVGISSTMNIGGSGLR